MQAAPRTKTSASFSRIEAAWPADRIRLLRTPDGVKLFFARTLPHATPGAPFVTTVSSLRIDDPVQVITTHMHMKALLPGVVEWDIASAVDHEPHAVLARFGGAVSSLQWQQGETATPLTDFTSADHFQDPRFAKDLSQADLITAVVDEKRVVLLSPSLKSGVLASQRTVLSEEAIDSALLVHTHAGPCLLFKRFKIGPKRGRFPGVLCAVMLDAQHAMTGPVFYPLGQEAVFEFDADVKGQTLAIVVTTATGFVVATGDRFDALVLRDVDDDLDVRQPAVAFTAHGVQLAFLVFEQHLARHVVTTMV